jgi:HlyD family secretion protein
VLRSLVVLAAVGIVVAVALWIRRDVPAPDGFAVGNGRLEAEEIQIATKWAGRIAEVHVDEGASVEAGQVLARMDAETLEAQLAEAGAAVVAAQRRREAAEAVVVQRRSECDLAEKQLRRAEELYRRDVASEQHVDLETTRAETARAACRAARARVADAEATIEAARAVVARIESELREGALRAPRAGRVQHRLAHPGEVLPAGGRVLTMIDTHDVYMTLFLPAEHAGRVRLGGDARVVLDAAPERPLPARVRFVAEEAQFTPKHVETRTEREKLSFRVEVSLRETDDAALKPGAPGVAWIRLDEATPWPERLR